MYDVEQIKRYILFLKQQCGLSVTLHPIEQEHLIWPSELVTFNIHENPYCVYVKTFPAAHRHCIERQGKILARCREGAFCGTCYAGVREFVYPIFNGREAMGFISVSGYANDHPESYLSRTAERFGIPIKNLTETYQELKPFPADRERIDTLLIPLCNMLELAYLKSDGDGTAHERAIDRVLRYVKQYHTQSITLEEACKACACSLSQISHCFKRETGKSFREYLTDIRLADACTLLRYSKLGVTEIAYSVGFGDSNYFSSVFRKKYGCAPREYRRQ